MPTPLPFAAPRNVLGAKEASSAEFDDRCEQPYVVFMPEIDPGSMGGTMRLGARRTLLSPLPDGTASLAQLLYRARRGPCAPRLPLPCVPTVNPLTHPPSPFWFRAAVVERHRHRYEVNPVHLEALRGAGLAFTGTDERGQRMECVELPRERHPFFFSTQFHPEFKSHPTSPSPPFMGFVLAAASTEELGAYLADAEAHSGPHTVAAAKYAAEKHAIPDHA